TSGFGPVNRGSSPCPPANMSVVRAHESLSKFPKGRYNDFMSAENPFDKNTSKPEVSEAKDLDLEEGLKETAESSLESRIESIAEEKLQKILSPTFKHFAVRFMHIGEYEEVMQTGRIKNKSEVYIHAEDETCTEYLNDNTGRWSSTASWQSDWNFSERDGLSAKSFIDTINLARRGGWNFRQMNLSFFHKPEPIDRENEESKKSFTVRVRNMLLEAPEEYFINLRNVQNLGSTINSMFEGREIPEEYRVIQDFLSDDNYLEEEGNMRKLYKAISFTDKTSSFHRQHHVGVLLDSSILGSRKYAHPHATKGEEWGEVRDGNFSKDKVLGAICAISNKDIVKRLIEINENLTQDNATLAHPVFDSSSIVRWPALEIDTKTS
ncbi:MAG: hypothetical protein ACOYOI_05980, partial [Chthoniobacterales bacterium]